MVGVAVAAAEQVDQNVIGQLLDRNLLGLRRHLVGEAAVVDDKVAGDGDGACWRGDAAADVAVEVAVVLHRHGRVEHHDGGPRKVVEPARVQPV